MRTISAVDVASLDLELTEPFSISGGGACEAKIAVVRLQLSDGTVGLGEAAPFRAYDGQDREACLMALDQIAPSLLGVDVMMSHQLNRRIIDSAPGSSCALCAVEMAALDAFTRYEGVPLHRYLGTGNQQLVTDITIVAGDLDHAARSAEEASRQGFLTLKVKVGREGVSPDRERLQVITKAAPECGLILDANGGFSVEEAEELMRASTDDGVNVLLFEQPVDALDEAGMIRLQSAGLWPICADESCRSAADAMRIVEKKIADCINVKTQKSGFLETLRIIEIARAAGMSLMIGGMVESTLSMSFSAHLARGTGVFRWIDLDTPLFIRDHPFAGGISIDGGTVVFQEAVDGHSVSIDSARLNWQELARE